MTYAVDPELLPWLSMLPDDLSFDDIEAGRARLAAMKEFMPTYRPSHGIDVVERLIPGPAGAPKVAVRVYTRTELQGPLPGVVSIHGGGFVFGDLDSDAATALQIADKVGAVVVSVGYRLAPENPFPAGLEDCYAALEWTAANAAELGIDPARIGVAGDSAGGGLTAGVTLLARDRGGPAIKFQHLGIPELDDRLETKSMTNFTDAPLFTRSDAVRSWECYLGGQVATAYAAPARAEDLSGLPPAYVAVCEFDPLRDEGIIYAHRLIQAGVPTELHHFPGTFHGSQVVHSAEVSKRMVAERIDALRRGLSV